MATNSRNRKLELLYFRYKDSPYYVGSIIGVFFVVSFFLIMQVIIPQVNDLFSINNEITATRERISNLTKNITYLNSLNGANLDADLQLTFAALPSDKDFASIIDAINTSALNSGVSVEDYTLVIGELSSSSATLKTFTSVDLSLIVGGSRPQSKAFIANISEILPLSQITTVSITETEATMNISFYIKAFPQGSYDVVQQIKQIPSEDAALFNTLAAWRIEEISGSNFQEILPPEPEVIGPPF